MSELDWDDLRMFATLARAGSVRRAAQDLEVHASTVTRRLDHFERQLDVKLFSRSPGGLQITAAGREVLARVEVVADQIAGLERAVAGRDQRLAGRLVVSLPDAMANLVMPRVAAFSASYPDIDVELVPGSTRPDVGRREVHCAIVVTDNPPEHLVGRRLGQYTVCVYATPEYLEGHDPFAAPADCGWVEWETSAEIRTDIKAHTFPAVPVRARCRNVLLQLAAVRSSMGIAPLPCVLGDADPALVRVQPVQPLLAQEIWILTHPDLRNSARVREFMNVVAEVFKRNENLLLGRIHVPNDARSRQPDLA